MTLTVVEIDAVTDTLGVSLAVPVTEMDAVMDAVLVGSRLGV